MSGPSARHTRTGERLRFVLFATVALFAACSSTPERPATYTVKRGDTLYSIAWRHGLEYQQLARWNGVGRDYLIYPGQKLRLYPRSGADARVAARAANAPPKRAANPAPDRRPATTQPSRLPSGSAVKWAWPVSGGVASLTTRPNGGQGLTITGQLGAEIRSAGPGRVVYTGSGLLGYGQLVIIKHNETYLSAYGHTQAVAVREGEVVKTGQRIATMGAGPQGAPMLYFEIRVNGAPWNPLLLLPQR
ncbi:MAG TPA: peptidoglycan DD-metalloendopeptidase family protein [Steroidobacter sp.]|nr:peptidoglycan DD-metalloendopeptidase family protein [Steroidobacter sp.]